MKKKLKPKTNSRGQKRVAKTRRKLKEAALGVFSEKGFEAATVEDITDKADLGKGTLYRHFADKEEMMVALIEDAIDNLINRLRSYPSPPETLEDVLEHFLNAHYDFFVENSEEFILLFQGRLFLKLHGDVPEDLEEPYMRYLREIEQQVSQFEPLKITPPKIRRLACAVAGFTSGYFSFAMICMDDDEIDSSIGPLRKVFVKTLFNFLSQD